MSRETEEEEKVRSPVNWRHKNTRRSRRKSVNMKHLDHPQHPRRTFFMYALLGGIAFIVLHFVLHVG